VFCLSFHIFFFLFLFYFILFYSVDEILGDGFPGKFVKRFGSGGGGRRGRCFLYPRHPFPRILVPMEHIFENFCT
jgi:hypothetical protein